MDTIDLYRTKNDAERTARTAWETYTELVQNNASGDDRLAALRAAIQADKTFNRAYKEWRMASGLGW